MWLRGSTGRRETCLIGNCILEQIRTEPTLGAANQNMTRLSYLRAFDCRSSTTLNLESRKVHLTAFMPWTEAPTRLSKHGFESARVEIANAY